MEYTKLFLIGTAILGFSACSDSSSSNSTIEQTPIDKIEKYAREGKVDKLTIQDYRDANFHAITEGNIVDYNTLVINLINTDKNLTRELDKLDARLNLKPTAYPQNISVDENSEVNITLRGEDEDVENLAYEIVSPPSYGVVESTYPTISGKMAHVTYTPNNNYDGNDSFSFKVFDGREYSDAVNVTIDVVPHYSLEKTTKNVADGYIIKLNNPATAICSDGNSYSSDLTIGSKGLITFNDVNLSSDCNITVPSGVTIDSNNNGSLDSSDITIGFEMRATADSSFISPLTTLVMSKMENGEDVTELREMVKDFDPVSSISSDLDKKLLLLMDIIKNLLSSNQTLSNLLVDDILDENKAFSDINVTSLMSSYSTNINSVIGEKAKVKKSLLEIIDSIDSSKVDISTLLININDGGKNILEAIEASLLIDVNTSENIFEAILRDDVDKSTIASQLESINTQFNDFKKSLQKSIEILDNIQYLSDESEIEEEIERAKLILELATPQETDAKVGLALFKLAEITNDPKVSSLVNISLSDRNNNSYDFSTNLLTLLIGEMNSDVLDINVKLQDDITNTEITTRELLDDTIAKLGDINKTLAETFSDPNYMFSYQDTNITQEENKLIRAGIIAGMANIEYLLTIDYNIKDDEIKTKTLDYNGEIVEYNDITSNPILTLNRSDVGILSDETRLIRTKNMLLEAIDIYGSFDVDSLTDEDKVEFLHDRNITFKVRDSLLGNEDYIDNEIIDYYYGMEKRTYYDFSALFNPSTALNLNSTLGHDFVYKSDESFYYDGKEYHAGDYNLTLSQYHNEPVTNYWVADDGSKLSASYAIGLDAEPNSIPTGSNSIIPNTIKKIEIIDSSNNIITFTGDDILRYTFNEFEVHASSDYYFSDSNDVDITYAIDADILVPYSTDPTYRIEVVGLPSWLHSTTIDSKTIKITADSGVSSADACYEINTYVNSIFIDSKSSCVHIW